MPANQSRARTAYRAPEVADAFVWNDTKITQTSLDWQLNREMRVHARAIRAHGPRDLHASYNHVDQSQDSDWQRCV